MDTVQSGPSFTVPRDGHRIGELIPLRRRRRFVPRGEFAAMSRTAPDVSLVAFRADQDAPAEQEPDAPMPGEHQQGLLDTDIMVPRKWINPEELPAEMAITTITLAEPSAGPHHARGNTEQDDYDEHAERARRTDILQRAENEFDPIPVDTEAARIYGRVCAAVVSAGRTPRRRIADLMIASIAIAIAIAIAILMIASIAIAIAIAIAESLPLFTTNPSDFKGLDDLLTVAPVIRPAVLHDR